MKSKRKQSTRVRIVRKNPIFSPAMVLVALTMAIMGNAYLWSTSAATVAEWNVQCDIDHFGKDDPIVFPGKPGASHMHSFFANTSTNAYTTAASLQASTSSCINGMGQADKSGYWVPSLYKSNADGSVTHITDGYQTNVVYYKRAGGSSGPLVKPIPVGLRMIAGNPAATTGQSLSIVEWDCGQGGPEYTYIPTCQADPSKELHATLNFPNCWDGKHLDSPDHKSHMAYSASSGACPSGYPVSLPAITFEVDFPGIYGGPSYFLSSGGVYSFHGDVFAAWDSRVQNALISSCLNSPFECTNIHLEDNTLFRPDYDPNPITINLANFSATPEPVTYPWPSSTTGSPTTASSAPKTAASTPSTSATAAANADHMGDRPATNATGITAPASQNPKTVKLDTAADTTKPAANSISSKVKIIVFVASLLGVALVAYFSYRARNRRLQ